MKVALVTGAAKRLGAAMARHLSGRGYGVVVHYNHSASEAEALVAELQAAGGEAWAIDGDLTDRAVMMGLMPRAIECAGCPIDLLINNASVIEFDRVDDSSGDSSIWDRNMATNLEAPYWITQGFAAQNLADGLVINMIDQKVWRVTPNYASYTLAKSALLTLTKTAAMALAPAIRVNAIGPGTTLKSPHQSQENFESHRLQSILGRGADVEDILRTVDFLVDSPVVTGQMIAVDGGQHLVWGG